MFGHARTAPVRTGALLARLLGRRQTVPAAVATFVAAPATPPPAQPPEDDPTTTTRVFSPAAPPAVIDTRSEAEAADRDDRASVVGDGLERALRGRVADLEAALSAADRAGDAQHILAEVADSFSAIIRQPPLAAQRALDLTRKPDVALPELVHFIERDPTLTQALLRFVNSAHYATPGAPCSALSRAVQRVGIAGVNSVIIGQIAQGLLCRPGAAYDRAVEQVWTHMVRTAPIARALAPGFDLPPDEAFTLGLLHDVGKLVLFDLMGTLRARLRRELSLPVPFVRDALRSLHEPLGGLTALRWGLRDAEASAIAFHHRSPLPPPAHNDRRSELLFIAERVDLAILRAEAPDLEAWWRAGGLRSPRGPVELRLADATNQVEGAAEG